MNKQFKLQKISAWFLAFIGALTFSTNALYAQCDITSGLIHHWNLDNQLTDIIGSNNLGGIYTSMPDRFANANSAVRVSGGDMLTLTTAITTDNITISLWYEYTAGATYRTLIGDQNGTWSDILQINSSGFLGYQIAGVGFQSTGFPAPTGWHHYTVTKSGTILKIYVDGGLIYTRTDAPAMGATRINQFGNTALPYNNQATLGALDDIKIFNRVFNVSEVKELYSPLAPTNTEIGGGLVYLPFAVVSGQSQTTKDFSGNGFNCFFSNLLGTTDAEGTANGAVIIDGSHYGTINHQTAFNTNQLTLSCWFRSNNISSSQRLIDKTPTGSGSNFLLDILNSKPRFTVAGTSHSPNYTLSSNTWYHIAATYNQSQAKIYINGVLVYSAAQIGTLTNNVLPIMIGVGQNSSNSLVGAIDEVRFYNTALSDSEVFGLYAGPQLSVVSQNVLACINGNANLTTIVAGANSYQWQLNGSDIIGAINSTYSYTNVASGSNNFSCVITKSCHDFSLKYDVAVLLAQENLIHHWKLNNELSDIIGSNHLIGSYASSSDRFNSSDKAVTVSGTNMLTLTTPINTDNITIALWYNHIPGPGIKTIVGDVTGRWADILAINGSNTLVYHISGVGFQSTGYSVPNGWHHFAVTKSGNKTEIFVDGVSVYAPTTAPVMGFTTSINQFGNTATPSNTQAMTGALADVRIYGSILPAVFINDLYAQGEYYYTMQTGTNCEGNTVTLEAVTAGTVSYQWQKDAVDISGETNATLTLPNLQSSDNGNYSCVISFANSCQMYSQISPIAANPAPTATISQNGFDLNTQTFAGYQWQLNGVDINGATSQNYTAVANGTYTVAVIDGNGCIGISSSVNITGVAIENIASEAVTKIYPNPTTGTLNITCNEEIESIEIFNVVGANVFNSNNIANNNQTLSVSDLIPGVYIIKVQTTSGKMTVKKFSKV